MQVNIQELSWLDWSILGVLTLSTLISLFRGFAKEALSLVAIIAAIWVASVFSGDMARVLAPHIEDETVLNITAYISLFLAAWTVGLLIRLVVEQLLKLTGLSITDRLFGAFFGIARGLLVITVGVLLSGLTGFPRDRVWSESQFIPPFQTLAVWMRGHLPEDYQSHFVFPG